MPCAILTPLIFLWVQCRAGKRADEMKFLHSQVRTVHHCDSCKEVRGYVRVKDLGGVIARVTDEGFSPSTLLSLISQCVPRVIATTASIAPGQPVSMTRYVPSNDKVGDQEENSSCCMVSKLGHEIGL